MLEVALTVVLMHAALKDVFECCIVPQVQKLSSFRKELVHKQVNEKKAREH